MTILSGYSGIFKVTNSNIKFYFNKTIPGEDGFVQITLPPGSYDFQSLSNEIKRIVIEEGHFTESTYPFTTKPNFSALGSIIEISPQCPIKSFMFDDSIKDLLGFHAITVYEKYNLSTNPVAILTFDNIFLECDIAHGMNFKKQR